MNVVNYIFASHSTFPHISSIFRFIMYQNKYRFKLTLNLTFPCIYLRKHIKAQTSQNQTARLQHHASMMHLC